jgi:hypothetical protein
MAYIRTFCQHSNHTQHTTTLSRATHAPSEDEDDDGSILGKGPRDESGGRGGETINTRGNAVVVAVAINTTAVAGIGKGVRIVHPPAAIDRRPPPSVSSSRRYVRATRTATTK